MNAPGNNSSETPSEKPATPSPEVSGPFLVALLGAIFTCVVMDFTLSSLGPIFLTLFILLIAIYSGLIRLWLKASRHMRITLGVIVAVAIVIHYSLAHYRDSVDWTSRGLDPERPGFRPAVVWLSGTISYWRETSSGTRRGEGRFDIIMRGTNHFYFNRWRGRGNVGGDFEEVSSVCEGYAGDWVRRNRGHSTGGGGGHHQGHESRMSPIFQGMWRKDTFVGLEGFANTNYHGRKPHLVITETMTVAPYQLPKTFVINSDGGSQTLHVRKVEFLPNPSTNWFIQVFNRRFNRIAITNSLNPPEPGWNLRSR